MVRGILISGVVTVGVAMLAAQPRSDLGGMAGAPFRMGSGAYSVSMGNATAALRSPSATGYDNPALPPFQPRRYGAASAAFLTLDRRFNSVLFAQQLKPTAGISLGVIAAGVGNIDGRNKDGVHTETYSTSENLFFLSFGLKVERDLAIGVTPKILYYSLFNSVSSTTLGFDVGAVYLLTDELTVAVLFQDLGSKYKWDTSRLYGVDGNSTTDQFPIRNRFGISYQSADLGLIVSAEIEGAGASTFFRGGVGWSPLAHFEVRAGVDQVSPSEPVKPKPSVGFTVEYPVNAWTPGINYAYVLEPYGPGGIHFLTVTVGF